jgi:hypothetical protein
MTEVEQFCHTYNACDAGAEWATSHHTTMGGLWGDATMRPDWRVWVATREGVLSDKELRLFACFCARSVWHLLTDDRSKRAVEVAEAYIRGEATDADLSEAASAASAAAYASYASYAASAAAYAYAADAAAHAAQAAYAANAAAHAVYAAKAAHAKAYAATATQAKWLLDNTAPFQ